MRSRGDERLVGQEEHRGVVVGPDGEQRARGRRCSGPPRTTGCRRHAPDGLRGRPHAAASWPDDDDGAGEPGPEGGVDDALDHRLARDGTDHLGPSHARAHARGEDDAQDPGLARAGGPAVCGRRASRDAPLVDAIPAVVQAAGDDPVGARGGGVGRGRRARPPAARRPTSAACSVRSSPSALFSRTTMRAPGVSARTRAIWSASGRGEEPRRHGVSLRGAEERQQQLRRGARGPRRAGRPRASSPRPRRRSWSRTAAGARRLRTL